MKRIIIVGAGFAGLRLAKELNNNLNYEIYIFDRFNHHQFQPLFYQVATAGLDASNISFPLRKMFHNSKNIHVRLANVNAIINAENKIVTTIGEFIYDYLVIATGADTNFFGNELMKQHALPMKNTVEALQIRNHILSNFETALTLSGKELEPYMNICIVGGGPTGVEMSGAIAEMKNYILPKDFPELDFSKMNIYIFEGSPMTLEAMSEKSQNQSMEYLQKLGVTLKTNTKVESFDGSVLTTRDGQIINTKTVIWSAGIKGNIPNGIATNLIARGNRIMIDNHCQIKESKNMFAIGDIACMQSDALPFGHPQVAPVAVQQALLLAKNFKAIAKQSALQTFSYNDKGSMATVGRNKAVVDVPKPKLHFGGFIAWMIWMGLHLFLILGVKNKLFIFLNWLYNYFTYDQSLRLIFKKIKNDDNM
jgi:NADH:ubiquinone reductase (H+-translocating)